MCGGSVSARVNSRTIRATLAGSPPSLPQYASICFMLAPTDGSYSGKSGSRAACARLPQLVRIAPGSNAVSLTPKGAVSGDDLVPGLQSRFGNGTTEAAAASRDQPDFDIVISSY